MQVVLTRPRAQSRAWSQALLQAGHTPYLLPLIDIAALADPSQRAALGASLGRFPHFRTLMFVSSSAVVHFLNQAPASLLTGLARNATKTRAWATGPGTVKALLDAGWPAGQIDAPSGGPFDSEALWQQVRHQLSPGDRVLVVRGLGGGRDWLTQQLEAAGVRVEHCAAYERRRPVWAAGQVQEVRQLAAARAVWLFSSSESVHNLAALMPQQDWAHSRAIATHQRIAQAVRTLGFILATPPCSTLAEVLTSIESLA